MAKHRPSWSERLHRAAALACSLLLAGLPGSLWAAEKAAQKPVPAKKVATKKVAIKKGDGNKGDGNKGATRPAPGSASEIGTAEIVESQLTGLHGSASYYSQDFHGRRTATGEIFDSRGFTAASNGFPLGSWVAVRRLDNNRCVLVRINDRMHARNRKRILDVSRAVAEYLDMIRAGVVLVRAAPLKAGERNDRSCHGAFEPDEPEQGPGLPRKSLAPASPAQLDAMH
ncbi:MAG TPA: septal ring lytic transglycosylase RlpA family protein [Azonexus sp.]|nr:septal ring lytic transglycosylase RlpA family protein [Azonexus sp.]